MDHECVQITLRVAIPASESDKTLANLLGLIDSAVGALRLDSEPVSVRPCPPSPPGAVA